MAGQLIMNVLQWDDRGNDDWHASRSYGFLAARVRFFLFLLSQH